MARKASPPATKRDIDVLKVRIALLMDEFGKLYDANERWKDEIIETIDGKMSQKILESETRITRYFDVRVEDIRHDLLGANKDKIESHEDRIVRLERHTGLVKA